MSNDIVYLHIDTGEVKAQAVKEVLEQKFKEAVAREKERILTRRPWYHKVFPFVISIRRR